MVKGRDEVMKMIQANRDGIRRFGVRRLGVFGSAARGTAGPESDLDFLVEFEQKSFDAYMELKAYLEDLFGSRIDLVLADSIKPRLKEKLLQETVYAPGF